MAAQRHGAHPDPRRRRIVTFEIELDLEVDGPFGVGRIQADGRSATFEAGGLRSLLGIAWWAVRHRRPLADFRVGWTRHVGIPLLLRLPGGVRIPLIRRR